MDYKSGSGAKPKTVCERLSSAIRATATTPFRGTRLHPQQHRYDAVPVSSTAPNVALLVPPPQGGFCLRVLNQSVVPSHHDEGQKSASVPIIFETTHCSNDGAPLEVGSVQTYRPGTCGAKSMNGVFSEYLDRAGKKIRSPTMVSDQNGNMKHDNFNSKVSDFIDRTRHRFHMPSSLGVSKIVSEEGMEFQLSKRR